MDWKSYVKIIKQESQNLLDEYQEITDAWVEDLTTVDNKLHVVFRFVITDQSSYPDVLYLII